MKILLFGKNGQLGWELNRALLPLGDLISLDSAQANFENPQTVLDVIRATKPNYIINPAAYTAVDQAEIDQERAFQINSVMPGIIAEEARHLGAVFIHYSTDFVFDGTKSSPYTEKDQVGPVNVYGRSKLKGEEAISQVGDIFAIFRTSWVYSLRGNGFVSKLLKWSREQKDMKVVKDQVGSPTWARMLAEITAILIARSLVAPKDYFSSKRGIYHLAGSGQVSRYDFARHVLKLDPRSQEQVLLNLQPALTTDFPSMARRPYFAPLDCALFEDVFDIHVPKWQDALHLAMQE